MTTDDKIHEAFNIDLKDVKQEQTYIPTNGVNNADREAYFDHFDKDLVLKIQQIRN